MKRFFLISVIVVCLSSCATGYYHGMPSDHFDGKKFFYPGENHKQHHFIYDFYSLIFAILTNPWPRTLPQIHYPNISPTVNNVKITFINHSTVLIETHTINILIDPIFAYRVSPFLLMGPARWREPGIKLNQLPRIDAILISHNHYDHMDVKAIKDIAKRYHPRIIVPLGNKIFLNRLNIFNVSELDWWQRVKIKDAIITFLPAHHSSARWLFDYNWTLWGSYGIEMNHKKIYFAGDTSYNNHFKLIQMRWGSPDFSFIPIGAYQPRRLLKPFHIDPEEAVDAHIDLHSQYSMGIHWGTFQLSSEKMDQPIKDLVKACKAAHLSSHTFFIVQEGRPFSLE